MSKSTYIKTMYSFWKRLTPWHDSIFIVAAIVLIAITFWFSFTHKDIPQPGLPGILEGSYDRDTVPNPFPGLPEIRMTASSGAVTSPKSDWGAAESPTLQIKVDKLASSTTQ